ncbi:MAG TPA: alpha/beta hydrolase, partial [Halothiobacillaceae bacterium]|nr:alpha/beta hydrolase [Halothiobacillaceae bacterium]
MTRTIRTLMAIVLALPFLGGLVHGAQAADRVEIEHDGLTLVGHMETAPGKDPSDGV